MKKLLRALLRPQNSRVLFVPSLCRRALLIPREALPVHDRLSDAGL